jgi:hypothetical protein
MSIRLIALTLFGAALAWMLDSAALANTARADGFELRIDCHGTGGVPSWSHTANDIKWTLILQDGERVPIGSDSVPRQLCDGEDEVAIWGHNFSGWEIWGIELQIDGRDAFWIDHFRLTDLDTGHYWQWGVDNTSGYCMSLDFSDGDSPHCFGRTSDLWVFWTS